MDADQSKVKRCWISDGIYGNAACPELEVFGHCRQCPIYAEAGRDLLNRPIPEGLIEERAALMAKTKKKEHARPLSVMIFRLESEYLALGTQYFEQVAEAAAIHGIPLKSNRIFQGIVNIDGELHLCVSIKGLLDLESREGADKADQAVERLMVIKKDGQRFVFPVDEVRGVHRISEDEINNPPATVSKWAMSMIRGLFHLKGTYVGLLREDDLFSALTRSLT